MQASHPIVKDLVLIGGGHSHAIALRMFGMNPLPGVRITLITEASDTPYSGMLPGHVAGFYSREECHIDLRRLAQFAQAQLYIDQAIKLDLENKQVICAQRPPVAFDIVSLDIGSTPATISVPGATEYAIAAKPISQLLAQWNQFVENVKQNPQQPIRIGVVGGGAGGVELTLSLQSHLHRILAQHSSHLEIHLFHRDTELMPSYNKWVRRCLQHILQQRKVQLHLQETVSEVQLHKVICESGLKVECDRIFWVTQASAPKWLRESGLATDAAGFVQVNDNLQSISHPDVFAAGDVATMVAHPRPKAGVFAVRQGKPLFENLQRSLQEKPLKPYKPQKQYLSLIGTGNGKAIAARGAFGFGPSQLLWRWKDWIDRRFMQRFDDLPEMESEDTLSSPHPYPMRCAGCGSKVGSTVLARVLQRIEQPLVNHQDILIGLDAPDDAAVVQVPANLAMVHTIDYFRALINDPYLFGQISANHCLSDIFAMGAVPQSALAIATLPYALETKVAETLFQLLSGAVKVLAEANTPLVGGHTTEGAELAFGLSCNGLVHPDKLLRKSGMQPGQVIILTKALGTGTLFAAQMRQKAKGKWLDSAIASMLLSNAAAATCFLEHGATACTDITGFGLLGHLIEMVQASGVAVELQLSAIPVLDGAIATTQQGIVSSLHPENMRVSRYISNLNQVETHPCYPLLFDPQTSGGLLATLPHQTANDCLAALRQLGYSDCQIIGVVKTSAQQSNPVTFIL
ncbi:selenide, water dikinase SelD [Chroogloeocystis siderophila]|uniref:Selenide, water dikinase SelD n=1 Tax=Chroogloeocystis siderophila 5.2 s.c.1 TaxID=247279 RepID=A0A1U7HXI5_9CHRO|nr:selenide, water dikinase SelD [Chroogloeocystis siderophila]OKH28327.1 selenide, water dikinase SelD [Chroogloeocystis siderophila 5.2 s.c.1]